MCASELQHPKSPLALYSSHHQSIMVPKHKMRRMSILHAGGLVTILEEMEARRREAQGNDAHKLQAAVQRARKAHKASRDKKTGRKDAEDALHEDTAGKKAWTSSIKYISLTSNGSMLVECLVLVWSLVSVWTLLLHLFGIFCCIVMAALQLGYKLLIA